MRIQRWKHPTVKCHALGILQGFAEIADGLITICSLGFYASNFEMSVASYRTKSYLNDMKKHTYRPTNTTA